jgi:hypothetical protein
MPGDWNGAAAVDHTDRQYHEAVAQIAGIDAERDLVGLPQSHDPGQQRDKTGLDFEGSPFGAGLVGGRQTPLVEPLFEVGDLEIEQESQKGGNRQASARASTGDPKTPQRQDSRLGLESCGRLVDTFVIHSDNASG